jgi:thiol-disulfide isomerase/thioredoxin
MRRFTLMLVLFAGVAIIASAQSMSNSSTTSGGTGTGSMMEPAGTMKGSSEPMMGQDMSYEALRKGNMLADVKVGMELRAAKSSGMKVAYTNLTSAETLAGKNPTVLFFAADWCPYCQADLKDINANGAKLGSVNVIVVNYDTSNDLETMYGVTMQDTYVQIGPTGKELAIWNGGGVDGILTHIVKPM